MVLSKKSFHVTLKYILEKPLMVDHYCKTLIGFQENSSMANRGAFHLLLEMLNFTTH